MRLALVLLTLGLVGVTLPIGSSAPTYEAESHCAWDDPSISVLIVPPAPGYALHNDGRTIVIGQSHVISPETSLLWDSAHAEAALRAVEDWERVARAYAPHLSTLRFDATVAGPDLDTRLALRADVLVLFTPVQDAGGRAIVTCTSVTGLVHDPNSRAVHMGSYILMNQWAVLHFTPQDTYNIMLHEFGHALGLRHVAAPTNDLMQSVYPFIVGDINNPLECISTLNLARLAANYQWLDRVTPYVAEPPPIHLPASAYEFRC